LRFHPIHPDKFPLAGPPGRVRPERPSGFAVSARPVIARPSGGHAKLIRPVLLINYAAPVSPRAARAAALPFALLAIALRLVVAFWLEPLSLRVASQAVGFLLAMGGFVASVALPLGTYLLLTRRARSLPAAFDIDAVGRQFIAPATPRWFAPWTVFAGWIAGNLVAVACVPDAPFPYATGVAAVVALASITNFALRQRPSLALSTAGITDQRQAKRLMINWDELVPGCPHLPATRNPRQLTVHSWTASTAGAFTPQHLPVRDWHVDPAFLAHTIRTYVEHSKRRAAIGTAAELARLQETFTHFPAE